MATTQKTVLKRYNGTDWDAIHLASSADIVEVGQAINVSGTVGGYKSGDVIPATATVAEIMEKLANGGTVASTADLDAAATFAKNFTVTEGEGGAKTLTFNGKNVATADMIPTLPETYDATKITGVIATANLPAAAFNKMIKVDSTDEMLALTADDMNVGDMVKVAGTGMYYVNDTSKAGTMDAFEVFIADSAANVEWDNVTNKPTTLAGYGITDAVAAADVKNTYTEGKVVAWKTGTVGDTTYDIDGVARAAAKATAADNALKFGGNLPEYYAAATTVTGLGTRLDDAEGDLGDLQTDLAGLTTTIGAAPTAEDPNGAGILGRLAAVETGAGVAALDVSKLTATGNAKISLDLLPASVIERVKVVTDDTARFALTEADVQAGDTVKVNATKKMYFVVDATKLNSEDGYEEYAVGAAASVDWAGVTNKPTTLAGYGITDAVASSMLVDTASAANAGKILTLNAQGKLDAQITGDVDWSQLTNAPTSTVAAIDAAVTAATHTNRAVLDLFTETDGKLMYNNKAVAMSSDVEALAAVVKTQGLGTLSIVNDVSTLTDVEDGQFVLEVVS